MTPAEEFAELFAADEATAPEAPTEAVDTSPRAPRPNMAQGASADAPKHPDPVQAFADMIRDTIDSRRGDGGWTTL